jgi:hypothetical protein
VLNYTFEHIYSDTDAYVKFMAIDRYNFRIKNLFKETKTTTFVF